MAAQSGHFEIAELLLDSGTDPDAQSDWGTPLHIATRRGRIGVATILMQHTAALAVYAALSEEIDDFDDCS